MPITFHNAGIRFSLKQKKALRQFIHQQIGISAYQHINLSFIFCSDEFLLNINRQYLNHDYYTDIITFPLSENKEALEAEIYISIDRVKENAEKYGKDARHKTIDTKQCARHPSPGTRTFEDELHRVMFHGVLHLLGHKDKTKAQKDEMRKAEDLWLKKYLAFKPH